MEAVKVSPSIYVYLHSSCDASQLQCGNTATNFKTTLSCPLNLSNEDNWRVALHCLVCERPYPASPQDVTWNREEFNRRTDALNIRSTYSFPSAAGGGAINVKLDQIDKLTCPSQTISTHGISLVGAENWTTHRREILQKKMGNALDPEAHIWEPTNKTYYRLKSSSISDLGVIIDSFARHQSQESAKIYPSWQYVRPTLIVLEFKMFGGANLPLLRQELVPVRLTSSPTENHQNNRNNDFRCMLPPVFNNNTANEWYVGLTSITFPNVFTPLPNGQEEFYMQFTTKKEGEEDELVIIGKFSREDMNKTERNVAMLLALLISKLTDFKDLAKKVGVNLEITPKVDDEPTKFRIKSDRLGVLSMSPQLAALYGIGREGESLTFNDDAMEHTMYLNYKLFLPQVIYVYADFVEPSPNGNAMSQILACVPVAEALLPHETSNGVYTYQPKNIAYYKLKKKDLRECAVQLRDEAGNLVSFSSKYLHYVQLEMNVQVNV